ncbi:formin-binding protein-related [Ostreococcus tauri]|uniref:Formin-binding protein-related n=1 Tax=Ostreococcus tauri TaxID=70448 RepID=A0A1Y5IGS2_OSTTA|nr:formin-binding protein-related [Ostreococcus tauri]
MCRLRLSKPAGNQWAAGNKRLPRHSSRYFSASRADWCALCKCFVQPHGNAKRMHERSEKHKKNVEQKLKDIRQKEVNEKKESDKLKKDMAEIEAKATEAYAADLVAAGRLSEAAALQAKPKELETALEREMHAREEEEYRAAQVLGAWKFDDRSKYYWHAKSSCYFDPKTKMYFNNTTKAWSKGAPESAPPPPSEAATVAQPSGQYALNPYARGVVAPAASSEKQDNPKPTAQQAIAAAMALNQRPAARTSSMVSATSTVPNNSEEPSVNRTTTTSMFNLGFGANHPKFEAAKAKTQTGAARAFAATGGRSFKAQLIEGYNTSLSGADASKKRPATAMTPRSCSRAGGGQDEEGIRIGIAENRVWNRKMSRRIYYTFYSKSLNRSFTSLRKALIAFASTTMQQR